MATNPALIGSGDTRLTGEGQQTAPAAAALANGGYVIAWLVTGAGGSSEVHAQRYDAGGAKLGGELLLNQGPAFGTPGLAALPDGGFVATWDSRLDHTAPTNYMARRFDAGGNAVGNEFQANAVGNRDHVASAEPVALAGGGFLVTWWANPGGPTFWGPTLQLYGANGAPLGGNTALGYEADGTPFGNGTSIHAASSAPTADGGFVSVWATSTAYQPGVGATDHIYLQRFDGAGRALANPVEAITTSSSSFLVNGAEVAVLAAGELVISLRGLLPDGRTQITAQRFDHAGTPLSGLQSMVFTQTVQDHELIALADGGFLLSWLQWQGEQQALSAQRFDAAGAPVGEQVLVGTAAALYAQYGVTATRDGGAVFAWDDGRLDVGDVFVERFTTSGSDLAPPTVVGFTPPDEAGEVGVATNIVATFSEAIQRGSGSIVIRSADGQVFAAYDAATSPNLSIAGATLTIDPSTPLAVDTRYSVEFAAGSVLDASGNAYAGTSAYNFATSGLPPPPPPPPPPPAPAPPPVEPPSPPAPGPGVVRIGTAGPDNLLGTEGADTLSAGDGRDVLTALGGNDTLDGGAGLDTAVHAGARGSYSIVRTGPGFTVSGPEGSDYLANVERLQFADVGVALDVQGSAGQSYRLYQAAFDRAPDLGGLGFWMRSMDDAGLALVSVAQYFVDSPEFSARYGALDTAQFVTQLYANVLHRAPDQGGRDYWIGHLDQAHLTRAETLMYFSESAENQAALIGVIENGMTYLP